jgi:hypothetical protein
MDRLSPRREESNRITEPSVLGRSKKQPTMLTQEQIRLYPCELRVVDAWPLAGVDGDWDKYNDIISRGEPCAHIYVRCAATSGSPWWVDLRSSE